MDGLHRQRRRRKQHQRHSRHRCSRHRRVLNVWTAATPLLPLLEAVATISRQITPTDVLFTFKALDVARSLRTYLIVPIYCTAGTLIRVVAKEISDWLREEDDATTRTMYKVSFKTELGLAMQSLVSCIWLPVHGSMHLNKK